MSGQMERDLERDEDGRRDVAAMLRAAVDDDWVSIDAILDGAEHSGTLRGIAENLLGIASESLTRCLLAIICTLDPGENPEAQRAHEALTGPLSVILDRPGIRDVIRQEVTLMQEQIVSGAFGPPGRPHAG